MLKNIIKKSAAAVLCILLLLQFCLTALAYSDIESGAWYENAANLLYEKEIMIGDGKGEFMPKQGISRAASIACLCKAFDIEVAGKDNTVFTDCDGIGFLPYILWGYENGICVGDGERFFPRDYLRREQFAVILKKICEKYGIENKFKATLTSDDFTDFGLTSPYAVEAMKWCITEGYFSGTADGILSPWKYVPRSEFAHILYNLMYIRENGFLPPDDAGADSYTVKETTKTRIVCWGDSLTAGAGEIPYPQILRDMLKINAVNCGVGGETAEIIAMRQGALPSYIAPCVIPADKTEVCITFLNEKGGKVDLSYFGVAGLSPVIIGGIEGSVYYSQEKQSAVFTRLTAGTQHRLNRMTRVITKGMRDRNTGDVCVYFLGTNNGFSIEKCDYYISLLEKMIAYSGSDKYVVIGLTTRTYTPDAFAINEKLAEHFGDNFLDIRKYLVENGLSDAGLTPTARDTEDISAGEIPSSLRKDGVHGNNYYYTILARQLANKFTELGYIG